MSRTEPTFLLCQPRIVNAGKPIPVTGESVLPLHFLLKRIPRLKLEKLVQVKDDIKEEAREGSLGGLHEVGQGDIERICGLDQVDELAQHVCKWDTLLQ